MNLFQLIIDFKENYKSETWSENEIIEAIKELAKAISEMAQDLEEK